ncbi:GcrA family cell cycle regulator [Sphingomonas zeae]
MHILTTSTRTTSRPDDQQLATLQFRIDDPAGIEGYSRNKPDTRLEPTIIGHYDLRPTGGRKRLKEEPFFWCCHCQKDNHWSGFVVTNETGRSYSVGKDCAASHYGVEFTRIRRNFSELTSRKGVLERLGRINGGAAGLDAAIAIVLKGPALTAIDAKRKEIEKAHPNAAYLLSAAANSGSDLHEDVQVRDIAAERKRADRLGERDPKTPIWRSERGSLGPLDGSALMRTQFDCRDRLIALRASVARAVAAYRADTNAMTTGEITKLVKAVEAAHADAVDGISAYRRAQAFFSPRNLDRISRWSASYRDFSISAVDGGLAIRSADDEVRRVTPLPTLVIPALPELEAVPSDVDTVAVEENATATDVKKSTGAVRPQHATPSNAWPESRVEQLRTLWQTGASASEIGAALGGVSRNAVVGKAKRLGLPFG